MSTPLLSATDVGRRYQGVKAVDGVTVDLIPGESVGLIGPNGAGKTTLFNLISGFVELDSGTIRWHDTDISTASVPRRARLGLIRTFQHVKVFPSLTVNDNLELARAAANRSGRAPARADDVLALLGLSAFQGAVAGQLSYGSARKLSLGLALVLQPELLMLDEPAAGLTSSELDDLTSIIKTLRATTTLWIVEHNMDFIAECCERVLVLDAGKLIADTSPDRLASDPRVIDAYLGGGIDD